MKTAVTTWNAVPAIQTGEPSLRGTALAGALVVAVGFGGFFGWAFTASLDTAALASGAVAVSSHRKTVSHLEGGILKELLVQDGSLVEVGQVLLRLDTTQTDAVVAQIQSQYWPALARMARLRAEQAEAAEVVFPEELLRAAKTNDAAAEVVAAETRLFQSRRQSYEGQIAVQRKRIAQLRDEISAVEAQRAATEERLRYTEVETRTVESLLAKGYERRPRLLELQRSIAELRGRHGELVANRSRADQAIAEAELDIINLGNARRVEVADELQRVQASVSDLGERLRGASDVQKRHDVRAPQGGKVSGLRFFTPGGVIPAGAPILDIVPQDDSLIIEARVSPASIDEVAVGQSAQVRLTAYRQRTTPSVEGKVIAVSADQLLDERSGQPYFAARVSLDPASVKALPHVELHPGMPAEVMIRGRARKAIDYFLSPITDSMRRAFRED
ncbi:MAG TPA: HlyD family type I secretion periplasmic adaptor subunit [Azospirillum sp.]|nr:HlyD family type I secretion periplasmic adaptor subunit [Azospirillum sp.]